PAGAEPPLREQAYGTDPAYLRRLGVEVGPAVPIEQVIPTMSQGVFTPVLVRPVFNHLRLVNPRLFETPAANTIPLFGLDADSVREVYGEAATKLVLGENASDLIADILRRPDDYIDIVRDMRLRLAARHGFGVRVRELIDIVKG